MTETLRELLTFLDRMHPDSRLVVWAHNSHLGDARATEMGQGGGLNVGQLVREAVWTCLLAMVLQVAVSAGSQIRRAATANRCAACHLRIVLTQPMVTHADQWATSSHAFRGVGCEKCHGGDATASDETAAHRGVKRLADPSSPVHRAALPATCGRCHRADADAFARSAHQQLLMKGDATAPTCTSCHSSMAADVPSPAGLEAQCLHCHDADASGRAQAARRALVELNGLRIILNRTRLQIAMVADSGRRASLTTQWTSTDASLRAAVAALHMFDLRMVTERLTNTRAQAEQLAAELRNR